MAAPMLDAIDIAGLDITADALLTQRELASRLVARAVIHKKSGLQSNEVALGITSRTPDQATPADILRVNRGHWAIENSCHYVLDTTWDEDHCRIRTGHGPANTSRLRRS